MDSIENNAGRRFSSWPQSNAGLCSWWRQGPKSRPPHTSQRYIVGGMIKTRAWVMGLRIEPSKRSNNNHHPNNPNGRGRPF